MYYDIWNNKFSKIYNMNGIILNSKLLYVNNYEKTIYNALLEWREEISQNPSVVPIIVHADQHCNLSINNKIFSYVRNYISLDKLSACIGLGDVANFSTNWYEQMLGCLKDIEKEKQINIWGNHDTWTDNADNNYVITSNELKILNTYFDNSKYNTNHKYGNHGIEYMIDEKRKIKYVVLNGLNFTSRAAYVITSDDMDYIIEILSQADDYDIVILSHIQPFTNMETSSWNHPPVEEGSQGGSGGMDIVVGTMAGASPPIDQMLIDRKNKASGTVKDSYKNEHSYDFTNCTSDLICCLAGHEHCDKYMWQNNNILIYIFDAYAYDNHPFYLVNINRVKKRLNMWKIDDSPTVYNYQIPFEKITT